MKVIVGGVQTDLGTVEVNPTISIIDFSRRETDEFGNTTVVQRGFSRRLSVRLAVPTAEVDALQLYLANLRATPATWIAHDTLSWLQVEGYFKDFEIDLAIPPLSYCTLTVEGLAETEIVADGGQDPAPDNRASTLLLQPDGGPSVGLGITEISPTAGINDFSRKVVDEFGAVTIVQRAWVKRMTARALIRTDAIDIVANRIAAVRATPATWIGQSGLDVLTIYGFFKDFSIEVGETVSKLSLSIEGISTAIPQVLPEDLFKGITTDRFPDLPSPPVDPVIGSLWYDANHHPYRFEGRPVDSAGDPVLCVADQLISSGWVSVRDTALETLVNQLQALDDDGQLTQVEKAIAIAYDRQLLNIHNGVMQRALALNYDASAVTAARAAYVALRDSLSPPWNDLATVTLFNAVAWDATLDAYEEAIANAEAVMTAITGVTVVAPQSQLIKTDAYGDPIAGQLPLSLVPVVKRGGLDIRTSSDVSYGITTSNVTASVATNGTISVTDVAGDGYVELTVTVSAPGGAGSVPFGPHRIEFNTQRVSSEFGTGTSGGTIMDNGIVFTWRELTIGANASGSFQAYGDSYTYTTFAHAWVEGGQGGSNAQDNNPYVDFGAGGDTLTGAYISTGRDVSHTIKLFALGK